MSVKNIKIKKTLQWAVALFCVGYIAWYFTQNKDDLLKLQHFKISSLLGILVCFCIGQLITCWRFHIILEKISQKKIDFLKWVKCFVLLRFFNQIMPQSGNIYSGHLLKKNYGVTYTQYISGHFSLIWLHLCQNLLIGFILILILDPHFKIGAYNAPAFVGLMAAVMLLGPIGIHYLLPASAILPKPLRYLRDKSSEVLSNGLKQLKDMKFMAKFIVSGIFIYLNNLLLFYICFSSLSVSISIAPLVMFLVLLLLSNRIMVTPGNIGFRELAFGFAAKYLYIGQAEGILVSIVIRIIGMSTVFVTGLLLGGYGLLKNENVNNNKSDS
ncbi:MAG: lysylphosphatidylglycerol synthase transmembrane domain-containing protein [Planctomycetota bacterium]